MVEVSSTIVGDAVSYVITAIVILGARRIQGAVFRQIPPVVWTLVCWICATLCFLDPLLATQVAARFLPFINHIFDDNDIYVPVWLKAFAYVATTGACIYFAMYQRAQSQNNTMDSHRKDRALQYVDALFACGYLMHDEKLALKADIANVSLTRQELAASLHKQLDAISICNAGGMDCVPCAGLVKLVKHPSKNGDDKTLGGDGTWPTPPTAGPLQDIFGRDSITLAAAGEAFRVWLVASERDSRAMYVAYDDLSRALQEYFARWCPNAHRGLVAKDLVFLQDFLQSKLGQRLDPPGDISLPQFKVLWRWFYGLVSAINSCSQMRLAWDRGLIAGCVDRSSAEEILRAAPEPQEGNVCFRFSTELNTEANFALVASVHRGESVRHVPIVVRPQNADRFLVPVHGKGTEYFKTFSAIFDTFYKSGWKTFQPSGEDTMKVVWKPNTAAQAEKI